MFTAVEVTSVLFNDTGIIHYFTHLFITLQTLQQSI